MTQYWRLYYGTGIVLMKLVCKKLFLSCLFVFTAYSQGNSQHIVSLHSAAWDGDGDLVSALIQAGLNPNTKNRAGDTPLHIAAQRGNLNIIEILISANADANAVNVIQYTPLHIAVQSAHLETVSTLLKAKANPNAESKNGYTPLHIAARRGNLPILKALFLAQANLKAMSKNGNSPLHEAAYYGHLDTTKALIEMGADPNVQNENGYTPLHIAAREGNLPVVEYLANSAKANVDIPNKKSHTALLTAAVYKTHPEIVRTLLKAGANSMTVIKKRKIIYGKDETIYDIAKKRKDESKTTEEIFKIFYIYKKNDPIHIAILENNEDEVKQLILNGADVNASNAFYNKPLSIAAGGYGNAVIIKLLIEAGAQLNFQNKYGFTPLYLTVAEGYLDSAKALLKAGADPFLEDDMRGSALESAVNSGYSEIVKLILQKQMDIDMLIRLNTFLHTAVEKKHLEIVSDLLKAGADPRTKNREGKSSYDIAKENQNTNETAKKIFQEIEQNIEEFPRKPMSSMSQPEKNQYLHDAILRYDLEEVKSLLKAGADPNALSKDTLYEKGSRPLDIAVSEDLADITKLLLKAGADPNALGGYMGRPLDRAVFISRSKDDLVILKSLLNAGAKPDLLNKLKSTPLHSSIRIENKAIFQAFIKFTKNINILNNHGETPLHIAVQENKPDIVSDLLTAGANPLIKNKKGETPYDIAKRYKNIDEKTKEIFQQIEESINSCKKTFLD